MAAASNGGKGFFRRTVGIFRKRRMYNEAAPTRLARAHTSTIIKCPLVFKVLTARERETGEWNGRERVIHLLKRCYTLSREEPKEREARKPSYVNLRKCLLPPSRWSFRKSPSATVRKGGEAAQDFYYSGFSVKSIEFEVEDEFGKNAQKEIICLIEK